MKKYAGSLFLCLVVSVFTGKSQVFKDGINLDYQPPSPEVSKIISYVDAPVSYNRGMVDISIPLYEVRAGDITIPIILRYNHKGVKPADQTMIMGLNWNLQAEPKVLRSVNGRVDANMEYSNLTSFTSIEYYRVYSGKYKDTYPDRYFYTLLNKSGSYFLGDKIDQKTRKGVTLPYNPIRIKSNGYENWIEITDETGMYYRFGCSESGTSAVDLSITTPVVWKATEIISPNKKDTVTFNYNSGFFPGPNQTNDIYSIVYDTIRGLKKIYEIRISNYVGTNETNSKSSGIYDYKVDGGERPWEKYELPYRVSSSSIVGYTTTDGPNNKTLINNLQSINHKYGKVTFHYNNKSTLNEIKILDASGVVQRTIQLFQNDPAVYISQDYIFLDSIKIKDRENKLIESLQFTYNNAPNLKYPYKYLNFWGYSTGNAGAYVFRPMIHPLRIDIDYEGYNTSIKIPGTNMDTGASLAGLLKSISNSLGGENRFYYSYDRFDNLITSPKYEYEYYTLHTGGLRIDSIRYRDPILNESILRIFRYGYPTPYSEKEMNEDGKGRTRFTLRPERYSYEQQIEGPFSQNSSGYKYWLPRVTYTTWFSGDWTYSGDPVVYDRVTEYRICRKNGKETNNGKTVYNYYYPVTEDNPLVEGLPMWVPKTSIVRDPQDTWKYGQLTSKEVYKKEGDSYFLIARSDYTYTLRHPGQYPYNVGSPIDAFQIFKQKEYNLEKNNPEEFENRLLYATNGGTYGDAYVWTRHTIAAGSCMKLSSEKETQFYDNDSTTTTTTYSYGSLFHDFPTEITTMNSSGRPPVVKKIKYAQDDTTSSDPIHVAARNQLLNQGIITAVMEEEVSTGDAKQVNTTLYKIFDNGIASPYKMKTQREGYSEEERAVIHENDYYGNPLYTTKNNTSHTVYLWSYQGRFPVAVIRNKTYDQVKTALTSSGAGTDYFNRLSQKKEPAAADWQILEQLRTLLPESHVILNCYEPFTGNILWQSDERGLKTYYDYDTAGRLIRTYYKEKNGQNTEEEKVIESYDYHYRNLQ